MKINTWVENVQIILNVPLHKVYIHCLQKVGVSLLIRVA